MCMCTCSNRHEIFIFTQIEPQTPGIYQTPFLLDHRHQYYPQIKRWLSKIPSTKFATIIRRTVLQKRRLEVLFIIVITGRKTEFSCISIAEPTIVVIDQLSDFTSILMVCQMSCTKIVDALKTQIFWKPPLEYVIFLCLPYWPFVFGHGLARISREFACISFSEFYLTEVLQLLPEWSFRHSGKYGQSKSTVNVRKLVLVRLSFLKMADCDASVFYVPRWLMRLV